VQVPLGEAERIVKQSQQLQYDGGVELTDEDPGGRGNLLGSVGCIAGGDPFWAGARSLIQSVTQNLFNGRTNVSWGAKIVLGPATPELVMDWASSRKMPGGMPIGQKLRDTIDLPAGGATASIAIPGTSPQAYAHVTRGITTAINTTP
jgi:hypothetical protein